MRTLLRAALLGSVLSLASVAVAQAAEKAAPAAAAVAYKVGDKVYVCACGKGCHCDTLATDPGKCHCGMDLAEGTVTKVADGSVTVKTASGEQVVKVK